MPFDLLFNQTPPGLCHLRPFGCRVFYRRGVNKLKTFETSVRDGLCLYHEGGEIYRILTDEGIVRTKHVRAYELSFPGLYLLEIKARSESIRDDCDDMVEVDVEIDKEEKNNEEGTNSEYAKDILSNMRLHSRAYLVSATKMRLLTTVTKMKTQTHRPMVLKWADINSGHVATSTIVAQQRRK